MYSCQQRLVRREQELINRFTFLCSEAHKLTNMGYYGRQLYFKAKKLSGEPYVKIPSLGTSIDQQVQQCLKSEKWNRYKNN